MVEVASGIGKKLIADVGAWAKDKLGFGSAVGAPTLFDGGGWLTNTGGPQLIDHQRSKPDAVLTNEQWRMAEESLMQGSFPQSVRLVVDGYEFNAYVDSRAGGVVTGADSGSAYWRAGR